MVGVDWCDAYAFCQWSGKDLCGATSGGPIATASARDTKKSMLPSTCSREGTRSFPYGNTFDAKACNGQGPGVGDTVPVGTTPTCEGGYAGVFDLSGNVAEWINSCDDSPDGGGADDANAGSEQLRLLFRLSLLRGALNLCASRSGRRSRFHRATGRCSRASGRRAELP